MAIISNRPILNIVIGLVLVLPALTQTSTQTSNNGSLRKQIDLAGVSGSLTWVASALSAKGVPIGIEASSNLREIEAAQTINITKTTVREILNEIVAQTPGYEWELSDGTVYFYPVQSRDELLQSFLALRIARFNLPHSSNRNQVVEILNGVEEVKLELQRSNSRLEFMVLPDGSNSNSKGVTLNNVSLKQALNHVVKNVSGISWWRIERLATGEIIVTF